MGGLALQVWGEEVFECIKRVAYAPKMPQEKRDNKYAGWKAAVASVLHK